MVLYKNRKAARAIVAVVMFALLITTVFTFGITTSSAATVPSGNFVPQAAVDAQGSYNPNKYYVFYNGTFYTEMIDAGNKALDDEGAFGRARILVSKDQKIVYVGDADSAFTTWAAGKNIGTAESNGADAIWINLKGATVIPGLHDSHLHLERGGLERYSANIFWKPLAEIKIIVKNEVAKAPAGARITATGWNQTLDTWNGGKTDFPTKEDLDAVSPDNPVVLTRTDGHANWANSMALRMSPYGGGKIVSGQLVPGPADPKSWPINNPSDPLYKDTTGGVIVRDAQKMATGVFIDSTMGKVNEYESYQTSASSTTDVDRNALSADRYLLSYGITSYTEAGASMATIEKYDRLMGEGKMKARGFIMVSNGTSAGEDTKGDAAFRTKYPNETVNGITMPYFDLENTNRHTNQKLTVSHTKTSLDGALGSRGARLFEPYSDAGTAEVPAGYVGATERYKDEDVYAIVKRNLDAGWTPAMHAIGDVANSQYLDAVAKYLQDDKSLTPDAKGHFDKATVEGFKIRPRIEHYQIVKEGDIERSASMNLTASMQFVHATSDMSMAGARVGEKRLQWSYAWRKVINNGMVIANGTDWFVDLLNPYHGLSAGVTRMDRDGEAPKSPRGVGVPWNPITTADSTASDERVTRAEALHYYTWGGAYGQKKENILGKLKVGYYADFAVIDRNYFDTSATKDSDLKDINALLTVVGGEICYAMKKPEILTNEVGNAGIGAPYAFTVTGNTDYSPTFNWSITDKDPALNWLKIDYHSGVLSGTPTKAGTYAFDVTAKNYLGSTTMKLKITVNPKESTIDKDLSGIKNIAGATVAPIKDIAYSGKAQTPAVTVKMGGKTLVAKTDYTATYSNNVKVGTATVTIKGVAGKYNGTKVVTFKIVPKTVSISKVTVGKASLTATWKKISGTTKYQIRYKVKGTKTWTTKTVTASKASITIKSLKKGKVYQVKVRAYKTVAKANYYGNWSKVKTTAKIK